MYSVRLKMTRFRNTVLNFVEKWNAYNVLCKVEMTRFRNTVLNFVEKCNACDVLCKVENDKQFTSVVCTL